MAEPRASCKTDGQPVDPHDLQVIEGPGPATEGERLFEGSAASVNPDRYDLKMFDGKLWAYEYARRGGVDRLIKPPYVILEGVGSGLAFWIETLEEEGYAVRQWPGGARAWKGGKPWRIRKGRQIQKKRKEIETDARQGRLFDPDYNYLSLDLAYCL